MRDRRWGRALAAALATTTLSGCSFIYPPLRVPGGDQCVVQHTSDNAEASWFGLLIENTGTAPITLTDARLGESEGATLLDALAIPEVIDTTNGDHLTLGTANDLATEQPQMWAARQPVHGFTLHADQLAAVALRIVRSLERTRPRSAPRTSPTGSRVNRSPARRPPGS